ncbi:MAG: SPOR domain-containing protein [Planctomycetota bacterium]
MRPIHALASSFRSRWMTPLLGGVVLFAAAGCPSRAPVATLADANSAYQRGDYAQAYAFAVEIAEAQPSLDTPEAAYLAGLAAGELGRTDRAVKYLRQAADAFDPQLAADAGVMLGLAYSTQQRYALATDALLTAAPRLEGEDRAKAYFYAAIAQQKLGRWANARDHLTLARAASGDPALRAQIEEQLAVNGYTLQIGSFADATNARTAADQIAEAAAANRLGQPRLIPNPVRPNQTLVHVGRFTTFASAATYRDQLGVPGAFVVPIAVEVQR